MPTRRHQRKGEIMKQRTTLVKEKPSKFSQLLEVARANETKAAALNAELIKVARANNAKTLELASSHREIESLKEELKESNQLMLTMREPILEEDSVIPVPVDESAECSIDERSALEPGYPLLKTLLKILYFRRILIFHVQTSSSIGKNRW